MAVFDHPHPLPWFAQRNGTIGGHVRRAASTPTGLDRTTFGHDLVCLSIGQTRGARSTLPAPRQSALVGPAYCAFFHRLANARMNLYTSSTDVRGTGASVIVR